MFIDMHVHAYLFPGPRQDGTTQFANPAQILSMYDAHGIECGALMPLIGPEFYLPQSNEEILETCRLFLQQYEEKTLPHTKINKKNAYFSSTCSLWYGVLTPSNGCERNIYYMITEFINKKPYLLIRFAPTQTTTGQNQSTPKISLYMSPSQIRDFIEVMDQESLERTIEETKKKAYTY